MVRQIRSDADAANEVYRVRRPTLLPTVLESHINTPQFPPLPLNPPRKYFQPDPRILATATDRTIIEVPVHEMHMPRRKTLAVIGRMNDRLMGGVGPNEEFRLLRMPLCEYTRYWARDERGVYVGTEPEGEGHERLRAQGW